MSEVLRAEEVTKVLDAEVPVTLVRKVSLTIDHGEFIGIQGPSGSGKSSLLYLLGLLDTPTSGKVWLDGVDTSRLDEDDLAHLRLEKLGFVFQFHFLLAEFTVLDNVMLPMTRLGRLSPAKQRERAKDLLSELGLGDQLGKRPGQLSGGQRQRVAIARAMANEPIVILADEPSGNLDSASSTNVRQIFATIVQGKKQTVLAVTHDHEFAAAAHRQIHIVDGAIVAEV